MNCRDVEHKLSLVDTHTFTSLTSLTAKPVVATRPTPLQVIDGDLNRATLDGGLTVAATEVLAVTDVVVSLVFTRPACIETGYKGRIMRGASNRIELSCSFTCSEAADTIADKRPSFG